MHSPRAFRLSLALLFLLALPHTSLCAELMNAAGDTISEMEISVDAEATDFEARTAESGDEVEIQYTGWLYDPQTADQKGRKFDSSVGKTPPYSFRLGSKEVIEGWNLGIEGMKEGEQRTLVIPPDLAYGGKRHGVIPAYSTLVFEIRLLKVRR